MLINSQMEFCREATEAARILQEKETSGRVFIPAEPAEELETEDSENKD